MFLCILIRGNELKNKIYQLKLVQIIKDSLPDLKKGELVCVEVKYFSNRFNSKRVALKIRHHL